MVLTKHIILWPVITGFLQLTELTFYVNTKDFLPDTLAKGKGFLVHSLSEKITNFWKIIKCILEIPSKCLAESSIEIILVVGSIMSKDSVFPKS